MSAPVMCHGVAASRAPVVRPRWKFCQTRPSAAHQVPTRKLLATRGGSTVVKADVASPSSSSPGHKKVVFVGGTGRVGAAAAAALVKSDKSVSSIVLAGRSQANASAAFQRHPNLTGVARFEPVNVSDPISIAALIAGADLVVHSAGPFQSGGGDNGNVLDACIKKGVAYLDVCDDAGYAANAKAKSKQAADAGVPCITTAGVYPGVSNVMAAEMIAQNREASREASLSEASSEAANETDAKNSTETHAKNEPEVEYVLYSYFCAGSGGVGDTILATSYMLCGEDVVCWEDGKQVVTRPATQRKVVDFGKRCGKREVFLYNLPETQSAREVFGARTVKTRFGTSPGVWNLAMSAMAQIVPKDVLLNPETAKKLASLTAPLVRLVDKLVGTRTAMRVDVKLKNGKLAGGIFNHPVLGDAVGDATAAFASAMLRGETKPGVWYPEETEAISDRPRLLAAASSGCDNFVNNQAAWMLESKPINLGFGMYLD